MLTSYKIAAIKYGPERPKFNLKSHIVDSIVSDKGKLLCPKLMGHEFKAGRWVSLSLVLLFNADKLQELGIAVTDGLIPLSGRWI
jgi:hypothetical protein